MKRCATWSTTTRTVCTSCLSSPDEELARNSRSLGSAATVAPGDETAPMTARDLESRMTSFQRAIETRDEAAAAEVLHANYALCLVVPVSAVIPRAAWLR